MKEVFGFVSEPHKNNKYLVTPATKDGHGEITCHDTSGFLGSWKMKEGGVFFEEEGGGVYCQKALDKANTHAIEKDKDNGFEVIFI